MTQQVPSTDEAIRVAAFRVALRRFFHASETAARRSGITPRQYLLLLLVKGAPDGSQTAKVGDLAQRLHLAQSTVTALIGRAIQAGLLESQTSTADRRVTLIRMTKEGERRFAACFRSLEGERLDLRAAFADLDVPIRV